MVDLSVVIAALIIVSAVSFAVGSMSRRILELERRLNDAEAAPETKADPQIERTRSTLALVETMAIKLHNFERQHEFEGEELASAREWFNHVLNGGSPTTPRSERRKEKRE